MVQLTFRNWGMLTESDVDEVLDKARDQPGVPQRLNLSDTWWAEVTFGEDGNYTLLQGRTMT
jgi:hypothetical protein